jgi:hypothetical protein
MPSHRGERWIDAALRSIATETVDGIEILLIDSSDTPVVRWTICGCLGVRPLLDVGSQTPLLRLCISLRVRSSTKMAAD